MKLILIVYLMLQSLYGLNIEQAFNIKTIIVSEKDITDFKTFYGVVVPDSNKIYDVSLRFDGFVTKLYVPNEYSFVKKGDKLFDIYSESVYNMYDELALSKNRSKNLYKSIQKKFTLFDINPNDKSTNDSITIKSKQTGYLTQKNIHNGSYIKKGMKVFQIIDLSEVWVLLDIYQKDLNYVKQNMKVDIKINGIQETYTGTIDTIYPNINPKTRTAQVKVIVPNQNLQLYPNMFVSAKIYENPVKSLFIPKNSVIQRDGKFYVFFKDGKYYTPNEIEATQTINGYKVTAGIESGDEIVSNALFLLDGEALTNGLYNDDW